MAYTNDKLDWYDKGLASDIQFNDDAVSKLVVNEPVPALVPLWVDENGSAWVDENALDWTDN